MQIAVRRIKARRKRRSWIPERSKYYSLPESPTRPDSPSRRIRIRKGAAGSAWVAGETLTPLLGRVRSADSAARELRYFMREWPTCACLPPSLFIPVVPFLSLVVQWVWRKAVSPLLRSAVHFLFLTRGNFVIIFVSPSGAVSYLPFV